MNPGHTQCRGPNLVLFVTPSSAGGLAVLLNLNKHIQHGAVGQCSVHTGSSLTSEQLHGRF